MCEMIPFNQLNLEKCADGLLPVVVQDAVTLKVLFKGSFVTAKQIDIVSVS